MGTEFSKKRFAFIELKANELLNSSSNKNPIALAKAIGLEISRYSFKDTLPAFPGFIEGTTIHINDDMDSYSQKIVCAHEIAHYLLHMLPIEKNKDDFKCFDPQHDATKEFEANIFVGLVFPQAFSSIKIEDFESIAAFNNYVERQIRYKIDSV